jgi:hypothetical protein
MKVAAERRAYANIRQKALIDEEVNAAVYYCYFYYIYTYIDSYIYAIVIDTTATTPSVYVIVIFH